MNGMDGWFGLFAQAVENASVAWWKESWAVWVLTLAIVLVPTFLAWLVTRQLKASGLWGRLSIVLVALSAGLVVTALGWPPRMGIDLKGGVILVYEIDADKQPDGGVSMDKLVAAVSRRVNPGGQKEVTVRQYGLNQLEVIVPEVDQAEVEFIKRIVSSAGVLEFRIVANPQDPRHKDLIEKASTSSGSLVSSGDRSVGRWIELDTQKINPAGDTTLVIRETGDGTPEVLVALDRFDVTGDFLSRASGGYDQNLQPCVNFSFNSQGAALFGTLTSQNLPDPANRLLSRLGIVLDGVLLSAPTIRSTISSDGQITGSFKQEDVEFLVGVLNAGSLPAALYSEPISEQKISPQLGADTIRSGAQAMLLATIVVLTFMLIYYRFSGLVADLAVVLNIILVVALMISIKAAFTLAGLAGLVLSVGMAVDANVLIYERMREELDRGASVRMAIRNGFQRAFSTIVDSNLTTLITGIVLFSIGTDQLKGFAVTLILGLSLNLFTAVFCSRVIFDIAEQKRLLKKLSMARLFGKTNYAFVRWVRPAVVVSLLFISVGLVAVWQRGQGIFDIDFTGGTSVQVAFKDDQGLDISSVREAVSGLPDVAVSSVTVGDVAPNLRYKIDSSERSSEVVEETLRSAFPGRLATYSMGFGEIVSTAGKASGESKGAEANEGEAGSDAGANERPQSLESLSTAVELDFPQKINQVTLQETIEQAFKKAGHEGVAFELISPVMQTRTKPYRTWSLSTALAPEATRDVLEQVAGQLASTPIYLSANRIGGKVAGNTKVTAVYALLASLVMIVAYVWLRFQNVAFGLAAVVALLHDVLVTIACIALSVFVAPYLGWALVDDFKISLDVVAALLTIVGFSINDTIVIFDRMREIRGKSSTVSEEMVDRAINQTLSRTILTSGTALLAAIILYCLGGQGIHAFAFAILIGIISGTYSTIVIASPIVLWLQGNAGNATSGKRQVLAKPTQ
ncbi:MAG: protein translocase subunit SecD [Planctomycetaceae bacterium]|nr:protein translocase subunit SecD [Planctomycetaceae bacterium]